MLLEMQVQLAARERSSAARCAVCHDALADGEVIETCAGCGTLAHAACRSDLARCPSLGCYAPIARAPAGRRDRRGLAILIVLCVALLSIVVWRTIPPVPVRAGEDQWPGWGKPALVDWKGRARVQLDGALHSFRPGPGRRPLVFSAKLREPVVQLHLGGEKVLDHTTRSSYAECWLAPHPYRAETDLVVVLERWDYGTRTEVFGATSDLRLVPVRSEDAPRWPSRFIPVPGRTLEEWIAALESDHPVDPLEAMAWVASEPAGSPILDDARLRAALERCMSSEDRWIAWAADCLLDEQRLRAR